MDMGHLGVLGHGMMAMMNLLCGYALWYTVYAHNQWGVINGRWSNWSFWSPWAEMFDRNFFKLDFWWDKMWSLMLLLNTFGSGGMLLIWTGMAVFNSPVFALGFAFWVMV